MHGRLKVRTTEEERERKKKEQMLKVRAYKAAMAKIQNKRQLNQLDDEMLQLTVQLLLRNPDITTIWNIRRECVLQKVNQLMAASDATVSETEAALETDKSNDEETKQSKLQAIYAAELSLTEQCLMVNPKSYNGWNHRRWTLEQNPKADWQHELQLCNKYLKLDERNFHTWDYRRYVTEKAGVPLKQELDFCTEKIKVNFSNYSSWHHRSLLLPILHPYEDNVMPKRPMSEEKLKEELEMVLSAAFTDPNDSSAWFYQRWLLGSAQMELNVCAFRCDLQRAVLAFTKPCELKKANIKLLEENQHVLEIQFNIWQTTDGASISNCWQTALIVKNDVYKFKANGNYALEVEFANFAKKVVPLKNINDGIYYFEPPNNQSNYTPEVLQELQTQLESCQSLLEFEPDSKWTLLTSALLMRAINIQQYHEQTLDYLRQLAKVDALRAGYYEDLASKWSLDYELTQWSKSNDMPQCLDLTAVTQLKSIQYPQYLAIVDELKLPDELQKKQNKSNTNADLIKTFQQIKI